MDLSAAAEGSSSAILTEESSSVVANDESNLNDNDGENRSLFIWNNDCIFLLLSLYEEHQEEFKIKRHKKVYDDIARKMKSTNSSYNINGSQCQSKMASLKKMYKKIIDHNNTSGNNRVTWPYSERMQDIFGSRSWVQPVAVASEAGPEPEVPNQPNQPKANQKRKLENMFQELLEDRKKYQNQKREMLDKFLEMKEKQHNEKMTVLKELCRNNGFQNNAEDNHNRSQN